MRIGRKAKAYASPGFASFPSVLGMVRLASLLAVVTCGSTAFGETGYYITQNGKRHPMARSTSEYAVFLKSSDNADASAKRLQKSSLGRLDRFEHFQYGSMFRLTTDHVSQKRSASILSDPDILAVRSVYRFGKEDVPIVSTGQIVLRLKPDVTDKQRDALFNKHALGIVKEMKLMKGVYLVQPLVIDSEVTIAERLSYDKLVLWANPNLIRPAVTTQASFADEFFSNQWHHQNTGDNGGVVDADIDTPEAWEISTGAGVFVGMIDSGVDVNHEDLIDRYIGFGRDMTKSFFESGGTDPTPKIATEAHGTAVAGLMVASANGIGVRGVAPSAVFTASRGIGVRGIGEFNFAEAFNFAWSNGVDVHNNSWGFDDGGPNSPVIVDAINTAFQEGRGGLGMVILFAAGNENALLQTGFDLSTVSTVIGVGATNRSDRRSSFSNFGPDIDILAPGGSGAGDIATTDNTDICCFFDEEGDPTNDPEELFTAAWGYNRAGTARNPDFGLETGTDIDQLGSYTGTFNGTSAACPIASGVAALILSVNPNLTATQVRLLMQHTTDLVSADVARYDPITGRSGEYAFGRINAHKAVLAAQASLTNGGLTWPESAKEPAIQASNMVWTVGAEANEFLIVQSQNEFEFLPQDGACYDSDQAGCSGVAQTDLPDDVSIVFVGCEGTCANGSAQETQVTRPEIGSRTAAIYARNSLTGRYSFGSRVRIETARAPSVVINVSPLTGESPLEVTFQGNAVSELEIDDSQTSWDFDTNDGITTDSSDRTTTHTYTVAAGIERAFTARLTMFDAEGNDGISEVTIRVTGPSVESTGTEVGPGDLAVVISRPGSPGSDIDSGQSPLDVEIGLQATSITGILQSVSWDLGDGDVATGLVIPHTYTNSGADSIRVPITATVRTTTAEGQTVSTVAFKVLDVEPGDGETDTETPTLPGTTPISGTDSIFAPCGATGLIPLLFVAFSLSLVRWGRRRK